MNSRDDLDRYDLEDWADCERRAFVRGFLAGREAAANVAQDHHTREPQRIWLSPREIGAAIAAAIRDLTTKGA